MPTTAIVSVLLLGQFARQNKGPLTWLAGPLVEDLVPLEGDCVVGSFSVAYWNPIVRDLGFLFIYQESTSW